MRGFRCATEQASDAAALLQLDAQIEEDAGLDEPALEELRVKRRQKAKKIADTNRRLAVRAGPFVFAWERKSKASCRGSDVAQSFVPVENYRRDEVSLRLRLRGKADSVSNDDLIAPPCMTGC